MQNNRTTSITCLLKLLCVVIIFSNTLLHAQQLSTDSLISALRKHIPDDTVRAKLLNQISYNLRFQNRDSSILLANQALELSHKLQYHRGKGSSYNNLGVYQQGFDNRKALNFFNLAKIEFKLAKDNGWYGIALSNIGMTYLYIGNYDSCILINRQADLIFNDTLISEKLRMRNKMFIYYNLGSAYESLGTFDSALIYYLKGIRAAELISDQPMMANFNLSIGTVYLTQKSFSKAINLFRTANGMYKNISNGVDDILCFTNIGKGYLELALYDSAEYYAKKSILLAKEQKNFLYDADNYITIGLVNMRQNKCELSLSDFEKGLQVCQISENPIMYKELHFHLGEAQFCLGNYTGAIIWYKKAIAMVENESNLRLKYLNGLSKAFEKNGQFEKALYYRNAHGQLNDSINSNEKTKTIAELSTRYETDKKEKEIILLKKESQLKEVIAKKENQKKNFAFIGIFGLIILGGYIFNLYSKRKKLSNQLSQSLIYLKSTQKQLIQTEREKEAENIRVRISRDIHDDIGHSLTKISLLSDMTAGDKQINSPEAIETLGRISDYSRNVNSSLSEIVWAISPKHDSLDSLIVYMRNHIHQFFENTGIAYQINFPDAYENRSINPELKRNIFLVLKESLNNILKYAKAKNVIVDFKIDADNFELKIKDDGVGFSPLSFGEGQEVRLGGNGLPNMKYRIEQTGGSFEINSSVGIGCEIIAKGKLV
ncbi:MAG: hypothetical protein IPO27_07615 [Bacteroidetes bacterium]|nr:hypothetical protein [Bacteroidota bacterium]